MFPLPSTGLLTGRYYTHLPPHGPIALLTMLCLVHKSAASRSQALVSNSTIFRTIVKAFDVTKYTWTNVNVLKYEHDMILLTRSPGILDERCKQLFTVRGVRRVAQSEQCLTTDWTTGVRSPTEVQDLSSNLFVQTGSGVPQPPIQ
jgi:hypothetical protein